MTAGSSEALRVAIVDGHELSRESLSALMGSRKADQWQVVYAGNSPREAVAAQPHVVVVNIDDVQPVGDVIEMCAGVPVVVTSSSAERSSVGAALMAGALAHIGKHQSVDDLRNAVRTAALGEMHLTPDVADILSASTSIPSLSPRELSALQMYASGLTMGRVAEEMKVSTHTAREYIDRVRDKYALKGRTVRTRTELYVAAVRDGFVTPAR